MQKRRVQVRTEPLAQYFLVTKRKMKFVSLAADGRVTTCIFSKWKTKRAVSLGARELYFGLPCGLHMISIFPGMLKPSGQPGCHRPWSEPTPLDGRPLPTSLLPWLMLSVCPENVGLDTSRPGGSQVIGSGILSGEQLRALGLRAAINRNSMVQLTIFIGLYTIRKQAFAGHIFI